jgi:hypothetical protein
LIGPQQGVPIKRHQLLCQAAREVQVHPGGPGASGFDFALQIGPYLAWTGKEAQFDIFGFDPRGIYRSTTLKCFGNTRQYLAIQPPFIFPCTSDKGTRAGGLLSCSASNAPAHALSGVFLPDFLKKFVLISLLPTSLGRTGRDDSACDNGHLLQGFAGIMHFLYKKTSGETPT